MLVFTDGKSFRMRNSFMSDTSFISDSPALTCQEWIEGKLEFPAHSLNDSLLLDLFDWHNSRGACLQPTCLFDSWIWHHSGLHLLVLYSTIVNALYLKRVALNINQGLIAIQTNMNRFDRGNWGYIENTLESGWGTTKPQLTHKDCIDGRCDWWPLRQCDFSLWDAFDEPNFCPIDSNLLIK